MNQRYIGVVLIIIAVFAGSIIYVLHAREESYIHHIMAQTGTCILEDGTCLHDRSMPVYVFGYSFMGALFLFGIYLAFIDRTQRFITEHQIKVSRALESAKKQDRKKDEFRAFLSSFNEEEQKVILAVREQDGIKQSTLRFRTGFSKTGLSLLLKSLEERNVVSRKPVGKTKSVYLIKKF